MVVYHKSGFVHTMRLWAPVFLTDNSCLFDRLHPMASPSRFHIMYTGPDPLHRHQISVWSIGTILHLHVAWLTISVLREVFGHDCFHTSACPATEIRFPAADRDFGFRASDGSSLLTHLHEVF